MFRPHLMAVVAAVLAVVLAACGGGDGAGSDGGDTAEAAAAHGDGHDVQEELVPPVEGAAQVTLRAVDVDFEPPTLELTAGEPVNVTVVNDGQALHDFTLEEAGVHLNVEPGEEKTTSVTIDEAGTYEALCTVAGHAQAGMTVEVIVT